MAMDQVQNKYHNINAPLQYNFKSNIDNRFGPGVYKEFRLLEKLHNIVAREANHLTFLYKCKTYNVVPKGLKINSLYHNSKIDNALHKASLYIISDRIWHHRSNKNNVSAKIEKLINSLQQRFSQDDLKPILQTINNKYKHFNNSYKQKHIRKLNALLQKQVNPISVPNQITDNPITASLPSSVATTGVNPKTVINLSKQVLTDSQKAILSKGLNFALVSKKPNNLEIISNIESALQHTEQTIKEEIRWKVRSVLERNNAVKGNITKEEAIAIKQLKANKDIKILPADKGNASVVINTTTYNDKLRSLITTDKYDRLKKDPTKSIETKIYKLLKTHENEFDKFTRTRLTPHHSKPPHIYGLPKIHKNNVPLRPIVSSIDSPCYALAKYLSKIISPLMGKTDSYVKNSEHFVNMIRNIKLEKNDLLLSFDVESLFTNVPLDEALPVIRQRLEDDQSLSERTSHSVNCIMELLTMCVKTTYFQLDTEFYKQKDGMAMGSPLSPIIANIYMEHFENKAITSAKLKPKLWLRYVDDTFVIWPHNADKVENFRTHLNSVHPSIKLTCEMENEGKLAFLDVQLIRKPNGDIATTVYRKTTHTDLYLQFGSNHHNSTKKTVALSLFNRAKTICSDKNLLKKELKHVTKTLRHNGYSTTIINQARHHNKNNRSTEDTKPFVSIPYYQGISEKVGRILSKHNFKVAYKSNNTLRSLLTATKPKMDLGNKNCVYSIPCECGRKYIGETCRPLSTRIAEHKKKVKLGDVNGSTIANHAWTEGHHLLWDQATPVTFEQHRFKRKFKESAIMSGTNQPISDPSVEFPKLWYAITKSEISKA